MNAVTFGGYVLNTKVSQVQPLFSATDTLSTSQKIWKELEVAGGGDARYSENTRSMFTTLQQQGLFTPDILATLMETHQIKEAFPNTVYTNELLRNLKLLADGKDMRVEWPLDTPILKTYADLQTSRDRQARQAAAAVLASVADEHRQETDPVSKVRLAFLELFAARLSA